MTLYGLAQMTLKQIIFQSFVISKENHSVFQYLGLHLEENDFGITLDQMNYSKLETKLLILVVRVIQ